MATRILRFPWDDTFVLVRSRDVGTDLELIATEGEAPYVASIRAQRTSSIRNQNAPCTQAEFDTILFAIVRGQSAAEVPALEDLEVIVGVNPETSITLTIRKRTQGITQRLGAITLAHDEEQAIELFEWCGSAVQSKNAIKDDIAALTSRFENQQSTITQLTKQLEDLLEAKNEHENQLLEKVAVLLNEKKLKIRDQQRLLAIAKVDPTKLAQIQATRPSGGANAKSSRNKRKAPAADEDDDESSDAFDKMDIDEPVAADDDSEEDKMTPDPDETASEAEEDSPPPPPAPKVKGRISGAATKSQKSTTNTNKDKTVEDTPESSTSSATVQHEDDVVPPPRQLPFSAAKKSAAPAPVVALLRPADDEETESDDEL